VLNGGRIEQVGKPLEVYHSPASTFVAGFIGSPAMNLATAEVCGGRLTIGGAELAEGLVGLADGRVTVGLRAEDVVPAAAGAPFAIRYVEELGSGRLVHGSVAGQHITMAISPDWPLADAMRVAVAAERLHVFDAATGRRIACP
jgi:sn-glycerol 3-phosphate transport system ATP-binding protein